MMKDVEDPRLGPEHRAQLLVALLQRLAMPLGLPQEPPLAAARRVALEGQQQRRRDADQLPGAGHVLPRHAGVQCEAQQIIEGLRLLRWNTIIYIYLYIYIYIIIIIIRRQYLANLI